MTPEQVIESHQKRTTKFVNESEFNLAHVPFISNPDEPNYVRSFFANNDASDFSAESLVRAIKSDVASAFIKRFDHFKWLLQTENGFACSRPEKKYDHSTDIANDKFQDRVFNQPHSIFSSFGGGKPSQEAVFEDFTRTVLSTVHHATQHTTQTRFF